MDALPHNGECPGSCPAPTSEGKQLKQVKSGGLVAPGIRVSKSVKETRTMTEERAVRA